MEELEKLRVRLRALEAENRQLREQAGGRAEGPAAVAETFNGSAVLRFFGAFRPFRLGLRKCRAIVALREQLKAFVTSEGTALGAGRNPEGLGVSIGSYQGHPVFTIVSPGSSRPFAFGLTKARVLVELLPQVEEFVRRQPILPEPDKAVSDLDEGEETRVSRETYEGHDVLRFDGPFHPFRLGLRKLDTCLRAESVLRSFVQSNGATLSRSSSGSGWTASLGEFKHRPVLRFTGNFRPFALGLTKARAVLSCVEDVRQFVSDCADGRTTPEVTEVDEAVLTLGVSIAAADGVFCDAELEVIEERIKERSRSGALVREAIQKLRRRPIEGRYLAQELAELLSERKRHELVDHLFKIAIADGLLHPAEEDLLRELIEGLGLPGDLLDRAVRAWRAEHPATDTVDASVEDAASPDLAYVDEVLDLLSGMSTRDDRALEGSGRSLPERNAEHKEASPTPTRKGRRAGTPLTPRTPAKAVARAQPSPPSEHERAKRKRRGRISSWVAYQKGLAMGDQFRIRKLATRDYVDEDLGERFNNLTQHIRDHYPDSNTAQVLDEHGQL